MRDRVSRRRWGGPAGCALSVMVHGIGAVALAALAHPSTVAAPFEPIPIALLSDQPGGPDGAAGSGAGPPPKAEAASPRRPTRRHLPARAEAVEPLPESPGEQEELEPPPPPPPASVEDPKPIATGTAVEPSVARALRVYDAFPTLPDKSVRSRPDLDVRVCVSTQGAVSDAVIVRGPVDPSSETLREAILAWRYRPFTVGGTPTPFCHLMRISYRIN